MKRGMILIAIAVCLSLFGLSGFAQHVARGVVVDGVSGESLAFVNILINQSKNGTSTDIDGKFEIRSDEPIKKLSLSYVGYQPTIFRDLSNLNSIRVRMHRQEVELSEVTIVPGINPAHRIIRHAVENRKQNDYEGLPGFSYTAYEKMVFTINADSLLIKDTMLLDTNERKLRRFMDKRNFFMIENVVDRKFKAPASNIEKVTATRVSGFKDPIFVFLLTQLQSTSFYKEIIKIGDKNYLNPIGEGPLERHYFQIEDTLYQQRDSIFVISFRPWKGKNFDGLKGVLQISTDGWGIKNVIAEPDRESGGISIRIQQLYEKKDSTGWFPLQLNTDLLFKHAAVRASERGKQYKLVANGRTYIRDVRLLPELRRREFGHVEVDVDPRATLRDNKYWNNYRVDTLTARELETYLYIDSIGKAQNFEKFGRVIETLLKSRLPFGFVDIDLNRLMHYNGHEGFYLGLGLETSDLVSRSFKTGGFWGYGFRDKTAKYGLFANVILSRPHDLSVRYDYRFDVLESGSTKWFDDNNALFSPEFLRELYVNRMDIERMHRLCLSFRMLDYMMMHLSFKSMNLQPTYDYIFAQNGQSTSSIFGLSEVSAGFRYAFREKFVQTTRGKISMGTNYPIVLLKYTHALDNLLEGDFVYDKVDVMLTKSIYWKLVGQTNLRLDAGVALGDVPLPHLYNARSSFAPFILFAPGSFSTMRMNEFYSDRYLAVFISHNFGKLIYRSKKFEPEFELTTNFLIGDMDKPEQHLNSEFLIPKKGYFESGLNVYNLLDFGISNLGLGAAYRYGPYHLPKAIDNLTLVMTLRFVGL